MLLNLILRLKNPIPLFKEGDTESDSSLLSHSIEVCSVTVPLKEPFEIRFDFVWHYINKKKKQEQDMENQTKPK